LETNLKIKGLKGGIMVTLPDGSALAQRDLLIRQIQHQERFFKGGRLALDLGEAEWSEAAVEGLLRDMSDEGVCIWAILSTNASTLQAAAAYGIPASIGPQNAAIGAMPKNTLVKAPLAWERLELESGQSRHYAQDQVLFGSLPAGAAVSCDGSLLVWGSVYGEVHANRSGRNDAWLGILHNYAQRLSFAGKEVPIPGKGAQGASIELRLVNGEPELKIEKAARSFFK
jgi:septum site-determining protein MinC